MLVSVEERNLGNPEENPWSKARTNDKFNPHGAKSEIQLSRTH